ncbi:hypothetical protein AGMMS49942_20140 [Spirochaetia bacterium]|nr:hypothetical protein AGMMS49942_20140 [Spirochaetia bacterium]
MAAYISSASGGGSAANPVVVKLNVSDPSQLNYNGSGGLATLFAAINGAYYLNSGVYKYVSFDLSGSTIANTYDMLSPYSTYCNPKYLASITLPNTLTNISNIFQNCSSLTSITIPAGVTSSWNYTFKNCTSLTSVIMRPSTPPTLGTNMFDNTPAGLKIKVANGLLAAYTTNNTVDGWTADIKAKVQAE